MESNNIDLIPVDRVVCGYDISVMADLCYRQPDNQTSAPDGSKRTIGYTENENRLSTRTRGLTSYTISMINSSLPSARRQHI